MVFTEQGVAMLSSVLRSQKAKLTTPTEFFTNNYQSATYKNISEELLGKFCI